MKTIFTHIAFWLGNGALATAAIYSLYFLKYFPDESPVTFTPEVWFKLFLPLVIIVLCLLTGIVFSIKTHAEKLLTLFYLVELPLLAGAVVHLAIGRYPWSIGCFSFLVVAGTIILWINLIWPHALSRRFQSGSVNSQCVM